MSFFPLLRGTVPIYLTVNRRLKLRAVLGVLMLSLAILIPGTLVVPAEGTGSRNAPSAPH